MNIITMPHVVKFDTPKTIPQVIEWLNGLEPEYIDGYAFNTFLKPNIQMNITRPLSRTEEHFLNNKYKPFTFNNIRRVPEDTPAWALRNMSVCTWTLSRNAQPPHKVHRRNCCKSAYFDYVTCRGRIVNSKYVHVKCCVAENACGDHYKNIIRHWIDGDVDDTYTLNELGCNKLHQRDGRSFDPSSNCRTYPNRMQKIENIGNNRKWVNEDAAIQIREVTRPPATSQISYPTDPRPWQPRLYHHAHPKNIKHLARLQKRYDDWRWKSYVRAPYVIPPEELKK